MSFSHGSIHMSRLLLTSTIFSLPIVLIILLRLHFFKHLTILSHLLIIVNQPYLSLQISVLPLILLISDHSTLLSRLTTSFGVNGTALAWIASYLTNRSQTVCMGSVSSDPTICVSGVFLRACLLHYAGSIRHGNICDGSEHARQDRRFHKRTEIRRQGFQMGKWGIRSISISTEKIEFTYHFSKY